MKTPYSLKKYMYLSLIKKVEGTTEFYPPQKKKQKSIDNIHTIICFLSGWTVAVFL